MSTRVDGGSGGETSGSAVSAPKVRRVARWVSGTSVRTRVSVHTPGDATSDFTPLAFNSTSSTADIVVCFFSMDDSD